MGTPRLPDLPLYVHTLASTIKWWLERPTSLLRIGTVKLHTYTPETTGPRPAVPPDVTQGFKLMLDHERAMRHRHHRPPACGM